MSLITRAPARAAAAVVAAAALTLSGAAVVAPSAQAADGRVCTTGRVPTAATQPWYDFAHSANPVWKARTEFLALRAEILPAIQKLGPSSTEEQVDQVTQAVGMQLEVWSMGLMFDLQQALSVDLYNFVSSLMLVDPASADAAYASMQAVIETTLAPTFDALFGDGEEEGALETWFDAVEAGLNYPLTGPGTLPSAAPVLAGLTTAAQAVDAWHDLGNPKVAWTSGTTCVTTSTLSVPAVKTTYGRARAVTVTATRDGYASRGDYVVLVDGQRIGSATQQSSYVATLPAGLAAGKHVLTVAFVPVDGSPVATRSSVVTVAKARTTTKLKLSKARTTAKKGAKATITVAVPGASVKANGNATIKVGTKTVKARIKNGTGTVALRKLKPGTYRLRATFNAGGSLLASSSAKVRLTVR